MSEEEQTLQELLGVLEEEHASLLQMETARLDELTGAKQVLHDRLLATSRQCRQLLVPLAEKAGLSTARTLTPLLPKLPPTAAATLRELQGRLVQLGQRLEQLTNENGALLNNALSTVNRSLEFFGRIFNRGATYGGSGRIVAGGGSPRLVRGEV
jgi:flagellar biosynthesis/type III secretory pathway chaperone